MGAKDMHALILACTALAILAPTLGQSLTRSVPEDPPTEDGGLLWIPVADNDCVASCRSVGLQPVGPPEAPACLGPIEYSFPPYPPYPPYPPMPDSKDSLVTSDYPPYPSPDYLGVYEGSVRGVNKVCAFVGDKSTQPGPITAESGYYCACVPSKIGAPTEADVAWTPQGSLNCPAGFSLVPSICRAKIGNKIFFGWVPYEIDTCVVYFGSAANPAQAVQKTVTEYRRLCTPDRFAFYRP